MSAHLTISSYARQIRDGAGLPNFSELKKLPTASNTKEVYATSLLVMEWANRLGARVPASFLKTYQNKLKGKELLSQKEISHIFQDAANMLPGSADITPLKSYLERESNRNMTKVVAETVLDTVLPRGSKSIFSTNENAWSQLLVAVFLVLGFKFISNRGKNG